MEKKEEKSNEEPLPMLSISADGKLVNCAGILFIRDADFHKARLEEIGNNMAPIEIEGEEEAYYVLKDDDLAYLLVASWALLGYLEASETDESGEESEDDIPDLPGKKDPETESQH